MNRLIVPQKTSSPWRVNAADGPCSASERPMASKFTALDSRKVDTIARSGGRVVHSLPWFNSFPK